MPKRKKRFADDGWAIWVDGEDTSTVYINDWLNPRGKSYVDIAVHIVGAKTSGSLYVYVPFALSEDEIEDVSLTLNDKNILQATFSAPCIVDYKKNKYTSEVAYNGKTVDIIHISAIKPRLESVSDGTLITVNSERIKSFIDNDEVYYVWRMPHKSLDEIFKPRVDVGNAMERLRDLITTPVVAEKYGYSIRINESRLLPDQINKLGALRRQKLKEAVVSISIDENYELNDGGCYRISHLEEELYKSYLPPKYNIEDVITYQWSQTRDYNLLGHFNFYFNISRESVSRPSMVLYLILLLILGAGGDALYELIVFLVGLI